MSALSKPCLMPPVLRDLSTGLATLLIFLLPASLLPAQQADPVRITDTAPPDVPRERNPPDDPGREPPDDLDVLLEMELSELGNVQAVAPDFNVEVTSVTKSVSTVGNSPAAIFVITPEMIRRSGATTVPDLLRMVPGLQVSRNSASQFAISSRGFENVFANKLLVLIDGRSIYTQLFGGVYWELEDLVLQDIERIEVIRGPGATVWGANAVNGVINIITRDARDTQGTLVTAGGGDQDRTITQFRYGAEVGDDLYFRVWGKYRDHNDGANPGHDDWRFGRVGIRSDWTPGTGPDTFTLIGQLYDGQQGTFIRSERLLTPPFVRSQAEDENPNGGHVLARWVHEIDDTDSWTLQAYYDRLQRHDAGHDFRVDIFDVDFQHIFQPVDDHRFTWGVNYREYQDDVEALNPAYLDIADTTFGIQSTSMFLQDEIQLHEQWKLIAGSKFTYHTLSNFEYQPGARLIHTIDPQHAVWCAVSRAVRTPTRVESDLFLTQAIAPGPVFGQIQGNPSLQSEDLLAYEIGLRVQETPDFSWDVAAFFNRYTDLAVTVPQAPLAVLPPVFPARFESLGEADIYGIELSSNWQVDEHWRWRAWYSLLDVASTSNGTITDDNIPHNTAFLMSSWDVTNVLELDVLARYVDRIPAERIDNYLTLDTRLGYTIRPDLYFSIVGQNLLTSSHTEFHEDNGLPSPTEVRRGVFAQVEWTR